MANGLPNALGHVNVIALLDRAREMHLMELDLLRQEIIHLRENELGTQTGYAASRVEEGEDYPQDSEPPGSPYTQPGPWKEPLTTKQMASEKRKSARISSAEPQAQDLGEDTSILGKLASSKAAKYSKLDRKHGASSGNVASSRSSAAGEPTDTVADALATVPNSEQHVEKTHPKESMGVRRMLYLVVTSNYFEVSSSIVISLYAVLLAFKIQYDGLQIGYDINFHKCDRPANQAWPLYEDFHSVIDYIFNILFTLEVLAKMLGLKKEFVRDYWNFLDTLIVSLWIIELTLGSMSWLLIPPSLIRIMRLSRLLRLLKLAKTIQGFDSLYLMTTALSGSIQVLTWAVVLLVLFQAAVALFLSSILFDTYFKQEGQGISHHEVYKYFGTFTRAMLSMFEITLANWPPICRTLSEDVHEVFMFLCVVHKLLIGFAVVGVINGVFMQETFKVAATNDRIMIRQKEKAAKLHTRKMKQLFEQADDSGDGVLNREEFIDVISDPAVKTWLASMELDAGDANHLWNLLDDGDGHLTAEELVKGVGRLKGNARSIDLATLMHESKIQFDTVCDEVRRSVPISTEHLLTTWPPPGRTDTGGFYQASTSSLGGLGCQPPIPIAPPIHPVALPEVSESNGVRQIPAARVSRPGREGVDGSDDARVLRTAAARDSENKAIAKLGTLTGTIDALEQAKLERERSGELQTGEGQRLLQHLASAKLQSNDVVGALRELDQVLRVRDGSPGSMGTKEAKKRLKEICENLHRDTLSAVDTAPPDDGLVGARNILQEIRTQKASPGMSAASSPAKPSQGPGPGGLWAKEAADRNIAPSADRHAPPPCRGEDPENVVREPTMLAEERPPSSSRLESFQADNHAQIVVTHMT